jgi:small subunit ribosomal protein S6
MNKYEFIYMVDARLSDGEKSEVAKLVADMITKAGGKVVNSAVWFERQRMSFPIKKTWEATYYLLNLDGKPSEMAKLRRELQINEKVLRFLIIRVEQPVEIKAAA